MNISINNWVSLAPLCRWSKRPSFLIFAIIYYPIINTNNPIIFTKNDILFDEEGTITILNRASCKGLEFDAVFIPELSSMRIDDSDLDKFKMNMYVMCSRARTHLTIFVEDQNSSVLKHLPSKQDNILEYKDV